jgi:hypothetical protein
MKPDLGNQMKPEMPVLGERLGDSQPAHAMPSLRSVTAQ